MKFLVPLGLATLFVVAWSSQGWMGIAMVGGGVMMWGLLHLTRMMAVLRRAANQPKGWVGSAVMLNAKLKKGVNLLHIIALTRALGEQVSGQGEQPEVFRWTDNGGSSVTCQLVNGRLATWTLHRPDEPDAPDTPAAPSETPAALPAHPT